MRVDRFASLRQRLRREADAFDFGALLEGVSTIEEDVPQKGAPALTDRPESRETPASGVVTARQPTIARALRTAVEYPQADAVVEARGSMQRESLRTALSGLCERLFDEAGQFRAACERNDTRSAGNRLAHINRLLEMLLKVDAEGAISRSLEVPGAPPEGRSWPKAAWTAVELAESPVSGLIPASAPPTFLREMLRAAWGLE